MSFPTSEIAQNTFNGLVVFDFKLFQGAHIFLIDWPDIFLVLFYFINDATFEK